MRSRESGVGDLGRCLRALALVVCGALVGSPAAVARDRAPAFRAALEHAGFIVQSGDTQVSDAFELVEANVLASASGNNAGQLYKRLDVPGPPGPGGTPGTAANGIFNLRPGEAIVWAGPTPPRGDYFSFTPFLWVRSYQSILAKGDWIFASVGDPLNSAWIHTEGHHSRFASTTVIVFTADRGTYRRIARAARSGGYSAAALNSYVMPSKLLRLGTAPDSDTFAIVVRTANIASAEAQRRYLADTHYASIFRVTPRVATAPDPYPTPRPRRRRAVPETRLVRGIVPALNRLQRAILARGHGAAMRFSSRRWFDDSRQVLEAGRGSPLYHKFVAGESPTRHTCGCRGTAGSRTSRSAAPTRWLSTASITRRPGLRRTPTSRSTATGCCSSCDGTGRQFTFGCGLPIWNGVASMTSHQFTGSANRYLSHDPMARYLYAVTVQRRPCPPRDRWCVTVPEPSPPGSSNGIPLGYPAFVGFRAYVNPRTKSGPDYRDIVPDRAIWFRGG